MNFGSCCGPNCGHVQQPFVLMPQQTTQNSLQDELAKAKANAQFWDDFVKSLQKEKKEEKGLLKGLSKNEIFWIMIIAAPLVNKAMSVAAPFLFR